MARITALFNTGDHSLATYPKTPFQILYIPPGTPPNMSPVPFEVGPEEMFYVPIFYIDDSPPIVGDFPNVKDRRAVLNYVYSPLELGTLKMQIVVDGLVNSLGPDYLAAATPVKLGDGAGGQYIVFAAFLTPMTKGRHTVQVKGQLNGAAIGSLFDFADPPYVVIVRGNQCQNRPIF